MSGVGEGRIRREREEGDDGFRVHRVPLRRPWGRRASGGYTAVGSGQRRAVGRRGDKGNTKGQCWARGAADADDAGGSKDLELRRQRHASRAKISSIGSFRGMQD